MYRNRLHDRVRTWRWLLFLSGALVFIAAASAKAAEPVRIGLTLGLTGKYSALCAMQKRAYELWRRDVNAKGGLMGRRVELIVIDDESVPAKAAEHYRRVIMSDRVDLVFSPYSSPITLAVAPIVEKAGYPMVVAGAASEKVWRQGYTSLFGLFSSGTRYTLGMLNLAVVEYLTTVAIVFADDVFSIGAAEGARKWGSKLGLRIVMFEKFKKGRHDLTYLAKKARISNADLVITIGHFHEAVDMRRALKKTDWYPKAYFATVGPILPKYRDMLGADAELTFVNANWEPRVNFYGSRTFLARFRALFEIEPSYQAAMAYAAGQIIEAAVKSAGSLERAKIIGVLSKLEVYSIVGRYKVDRTGAQIKHVPLTMQWQKGKKEIVWPEEMRTAKPVFN